MDEVWPDLPSRLIVKCLDIATPGLPTYLLPSSTTNLPHGIVRYSIIIATKHHHPPSPFRTPILKDVVLKTAQRRHLSHPSKFQPAHLLVCRVSVQYLASLPARVSRRRLHRPCHKRCTHSPLGHNPLFGPVLPARATELFVLILRNSVPPSSALLPCAPSAFHGIQSCFSLFSMEDGIRRKPSW